MWDAGAAYSNYRIAVVGWGSLIWDPRGLQLATQWTKNGPVLPIEFSRISKDGRLTLVVDERNGVDVPTYYALSSLGELALAIENLREREGTDQRGIGFIDIVHSRTSDRAMMEHPVACERIRLWTANKGFDAAIWTALGSQFHKKRRVPFSVAAAVQYLSALRGPTRTRALDYIRNAPAEVATPVRERVSTVFRGEL